MYVHSIFYIHSTYILVHMAFCCRWGVLSKTLYIFEQFVDGIDDKLYVKVIMS